MSRDVDILGPPLDGEQATALVASAMGHWRHAKRSTIQVMSDLRRLQNGQVHLLYGYDNFSTWVEDTFDGLAAGNVRQLCRAGAVVLTLQERGILKQDNPTGVGTTGLRELATITGTFGDDKMVEVLLEARARLEPRTPDVDISGPMIKAAMRLLMPPAETLQQKIDDAHDAEQEEWEDEPEHSSKMQEIMDRIRDLSWDLPESKHDISQALMQLLAEENQEPNDGDQEWIEGSR